MERNTSKSKYVPVSLTEEFILNWSAVRPELYGWRYYRIEYGGHAQSCFKEEVIYLPPYGDPGVLELLFELWQAKGRSRRKILHEIVQALERGMGGR